MTPQDDITLAELARDIKEIKAMVKDQNGRVREHDKAIAILVDRSDRQNRTAALLGTGFGGAVSAMIAGISAWLGGH